MSITGATMSLLLLLAVVAITVWAFIGLSWESATKECQRNNANGLQSMMVKKWYGWVVVDRPDFKEYRYYPLASATGQVSDWSYLLQPRNGGILPRGTFDKDMAIVCDSEEDARGFLGIWQEYGYKTMIYKEPVEGSV